MAAMTGHGAHRVAWLAFHDAPRGGSRPGNVTATRSQASLLLLIAPSRGRRRLSHHPSLHRSRFSGLTASWLPYISPYTGRGLAQFHQTIYWVGYQDFFFVPGHTPTPAFDGSTTLQTHSRLRESERIGGDEAHSCTMLRANDVSNADTAYYDKKLVAASSFAKTRGTRRAPAPTKLRMRPEQGTTCAGATATRFGFGWWPPIKSSKS